MAHEKLRPEFTFDDDKINQLKQIVPECFEDGKINFETLRQNLGDWAQEEDDDTLEHFGLFWPGKKQARKLAAIPSEGTLEPVFGEGLKPDGTSDTDGKNDSKNIFIEGENLEVLKILQKSYANRIKMIYIDPPYNTGNDFVYDDDFTEPLQEYLRRTGQVDEEGKPLTTNKRSDGRFHSKWLSMMYPRLRLARNLLKDDGVIFISIDDNEIHNLRAIMNEIFGEENFISEIIRESIKGGSRSQFLRVTHDYLLCYGKEKSMINFSGYEKDPIVLDQNDDKGPYKKGRELNKWGAGSRREDSPGMWFPITGPDGIKVFPIRNDGSEGRWRLGKAKMKKIVEDGDVIFEKREDGSYIVYEKIRSTEIGHKQFTSLFKDNYLNSKGTEAIKKLYNSERSFFDYAKPIELMYDLMVMSDLEDDDIILDFFGGSGSTAESVLNYSKDFNININFLLVQMKEDFETDSIGRNNGFEIIPQFTKDRIRKSIKNNDLEVGFECFKLSVSNYKKWQDINSTNISQVELALDEFAISPLKPDWSKNKLLTEIQLLEGFPLDSKMETTNFGKNEINQISHDHLETKLLICLDDKIEENLISDLKLDSNTIFICLDTAISNQDKLRLSDKGLIKTI